MTGNYEQRALPQLSEVEILESMKPDGIVDQILQMGQEVAELEQKMNKASEVLEGAYGVTVEDVLSRRTAQGSSLPSDDGEK